MEINDDIERETTEDMFDDTLQGDDSLYVLYFAENKNIADGGRFWSSDHWDPEPDYVHINNSWFTEGKNAASVAVTSPYIDEQSNNPITTITCKVNKNGSFAGLTAVDIQLTKLTEIVSDAQLSPSGKSFILTADGAYLTNENPDKILSKNFLLRRLQEPHPATRAKQKAFHFELLHNFHYIPRGTLGVLLNSKTKENIFLLKYFLLFSSIYSLLG